MAENENPVSPPPRGKTHLLVRVVVGLALVGVGIVVGLLLWAGDDDADRPTVVAPTVRADLGYAYQNCRQCHADFDKATTAKQATDVIFSHVRHFGRAIGDCATCHLADTHRPDKTTRPTMDRCYQCHGTTRVSTASGRCLTCHPATFIRKPDTHVTGWAGARHAAEAKVDRKQCLSCHVEKTFCANCHSGTGPPSHQLVGWSTGSHRDAAEGNRAQCLSCHNQRTFCAACHARSRPASHRISGWANGGHEHQAEGNRAYCLTCHNQRTFCATCHAAKED